MFNILSGKTLAKAVAGIGAKAETFSKALHQVCASAANHAAKHGDATHCNGVYNAVPLNVRGAVRQWMQAFAPVTFDGESMAFTYAKGKLAAFDLEAACKPENSPLAFQRESKAGKASKTVASILKACRKALEAIKADKAIIATITALIDANEPAKAKRTSVVLQAIAAPAKTVKQPAKAKRKAARKAATDKAAATRARKASKAKAKDVANIVKLETSKTRAA